MSFISRWWSGSNDSSTEEVLGLEDNDTSSEKILQALQLKRMQQVQESKKLKKQAREANDAKNRESAAMFLRQKAIVDTRIKQMDGQIHNMQSQSTAMETAAMSAQMTRALRREADSMRRIVKTVSVDDVEELTDDLFELSTQSYEMGDALARPIGAPFMPIGVDDAIEDQLNEWNSPVPIKEPSRVSPQITPSQVPNQEHAENIFLPSVPVRNDTKLRN